MARKTVQLLILFGLFIGIIGQQQSVFASLDANEQKAFIELNPENWSDV